MTDLGGTVSDIARMFHVELLERFKFHRCNCRVAVVGGIPTIMLTVRNRVCYLEFKEGTAVLQHRKHMEFHTTLSLGVFEYVDPDFVESVFDVVGGWVGCCGGNDAG